MGFAPKSNFNRLPKNLFGKSVFCPKLGETKRFPPWRTRWVKLFFLWFKRKCLNHPLISQLCFTYCLQYTELSKTQNRIFVKFLHALNITWRCLLFWEVFPHLSFSRHHILFHFMKFDYLEIMYYRSKSKTSRDL